MDANTIYGKLKDELKTSFGVTPQSATDEQVFHCTASCLRSIMLDKRLAFEANAVSNKKVSYLCMEFLLGRSLLMNLSAIGLKNEFESALGDLGFSLQDIAKVERDPGTGNGGLGRLAACFMDSLAGLGYNAIGYSLCYEYGLFRQKIIEGEQKELPDNWKRYDSELLLHRSEKRYNVIFGGRVEEEWRNGRMYVKLREGYEVTAEAYDFFVPGYDSGAVLPIRFWQVVLPSLPDTDFKSKKEYEFMRRAEGFFSQLTSTLYPDDSSYVGKILRLCQQYFLVSASLQDLIADHLKSHKTLDDFAAFNAVHINDTHPALAIPELMRILVDEYNYEWNDAWKITTSAVSYTNHTVMPEALECWNENMLKELLPRIYAIISEINRRFTTSLWHDMPDDWGRVGDMAVIGGGNIKMANLCVIGSHRVNGVSEIHSQILKDRVFAGYNQIYPDKFCNVTNGIAYRRWLCQANPRLTSLISSAIGDGFIKDALELSKLNDFTSNDIFLEDVAHQRAQNKRDFSSFAKSRFDCELDPDSIYDVQIKRLHEYKRQLMNALRIISLYSDIKDNARLPSRPISFIFGAKAAPGYKFAKRIIRLLWCLGQEILRDTEARKYLSVLFMDDYNVSLAERIIPASDISEQISLAGKEASGTGNMKLMLNGALTIGTLDGANVEICDAVGKDNIFIFGMNEKEAVSLAQIKYDPTEFANTERVKKILKMLKIGFCGESFSDVADYLTKGLGGSADPFMCLADLDSYCKASERAYALYENKGAWYSSALKNIAEAGRFSSDNSIKEYAENIWNIVPVKEKEHAL